MLEFIAKIQIDKISSKEPVSTVRENLQNVIARLLFKRERRGPVDIPVILRDVRDILVVLLEKFTYTFKYSEVGKGLVWLDVALNVIQKAALYLED